MVFSSLKLLQSPAVSLSSELLQTNNQNHPPHSAVSAFPCSQKLHWSFRFYHEKGTTWYQKKVELNVHSPQMQRHISHLRALCNLLFPRYFSYFLFHFLCQCSNCGVERETTRLQVISLCWVSCCTNCFLNITSALHWFNTRKSKSTGIMADSTS